MTGTFEHARAGECRSLSSGTYHENMATLAALETEGRQARRPLIARFCNRYACRLRNCSHNCLSPRIQIVYIVFSRNSDATVLILDFRIPTALSPFNVEPICTPARTIRALHVGGAKQSCSGSDSTNVCIVEDWHVSAFQMRAYKIVHFPWNSKRIYFSRLVDVPYHYSVFYFLSGHS